MLLRRAGGLLLRRCSTAAAPAASPSPASSASPPSSTTPASSASPAPSELHITPAAVARLKAVAKPGQRLRVEVDSGGCSGFEYKFRLEEPGTDDHGGDHVYSQDGAEVVVDALSLDLMRGSTLDYAEELIRSSFRVSANPLAEKGCSCGASFALRMD